MAHLTEADTCRKFVLPKLYSAGWTDDQISEQRTFTDGRIVVAGKKAIRRPQKRADYLLKYRRDFGLAVIEAKPDGPSTIDNLRGSLPGWAFVTWIALQTNRLARRNFIQQLETDPRRLRLSRMVETLPQGMKKGDPLYWWYIGLEGLILFMGSANIGVELWSWLHGESNAGWWRIVTALIVFVVSVVAWRYVKTANRAAVAAIKAHV